MKNFQFNGKHLVIAFVLLVSGLSFGFKANNNTTQITICHTPPGNPGNCHEITVSMNALEAHLKHGDNMVCHSKEDFPTYSEIYNQFIASNPYSQISLERAYYY